MPDTIDPSNVTLDDFTYFWMNNGAPCFIVNNWDVVDNVCETIESFGFQIYYLICDKSTPKNVTTKDAKGVSTTTTVYEYTPAVLKVVNNFTGRVVMDSNDAFGNNFAAVEESAEYNMPPIPRVIVDKLDEFFRLVDAQHHTESIVILTYDTTKEGSDGWGVLVPDQENTSVHCKYDADSIAEIKPDHVMIVGSVHSHPNMAAYASGTDHADQADFDGVHITYGWQSGVNGGATQYHIELQIGGAAYTLKPEDVFESYTINKDPDPEVVEWSQKVKKVQPLYTGGSATQALYSTPATALKAPSSQHTQAGTATSYYDKQQFLDHVDKVEPDAVVAVEVDEYSPNALCMVCGFNVTSLDVNSGFCMTCDSPIITSLQGHYDIISSLHAYCLQRDLDPTAAYYVYCVDENNSSSNFLLNIKPKGIAPEQAGSEYDKDTYLIKQEHTLCCNLPLSQLANCICTKTVLEEDINSFDIAHRDVDIYDEKSKCYECVNYYDSSCPAFRSAVVNFITTNKSIDQPIQDCELFVHYKISENQTLVYSYDFAEGYYD